MATRYDVSGVPVQGGYIAKQCPVRAQNDHTFETVEIPVPADLQRRFDRGNDFEDQVFETLATLHPGTAAVFIPEDLRKADAIAATDAAMNDRAPIIAGGWLPDDTQGRRTGKPDLLVLAGDDSGYRAVDVKHHMTLDHLDDDKDTKWPAITAPLAAPTWEAAAPLAQHQLRRANGAKSDTLQLAHYQRMLEAAGLAADGARMAGIIGVEGQVVWYDLDAAMWQTPAKSDGKKRKYRTSMERYDFEFDFRLDIIAVALGEPSQQPNIPVVPARCSECPTCPWRDHCLPLLEEQDDLTLLPTISWKQRVVHHAHGVTTRHQLAALDPDTPDYEGSGVGNLAAQIDLALAATGPDPVYRTRGTQHVGIPRADIEIDVDMENIEEGVYLWGTLRSDRTTDVAPVYEPFVTWNEPTEDEVLETFRRFWEWLLDEQRAAEAAGRSFAAYYYTDAETRYLRDYGAALGILDAVEEFVASDAWVDVAKAVGAQLITGRGMGLKDIAPLADFHWEVDDPGGSVSMQYYDWAIGVSEPEAPLDAAGAQAWLLKYNRNDVEATLAIRDWLDEAGERIKVVGS